MKDCDQNKYYVQYLKENYDVTRSNRNNKMETDSNKEEIKKMLDKRFEEKEKYFI